MIVAKKRYYRYELIDGSEIVYIGITGYLSRKRAKHKAKGWQYTKMNIIGFEVTKGSAKQWREERLEQYRKTHEGRNPKYNEIEV